MSEYLSRIKSPADVKKLSMVELERLAEEIRERLILGWRRRADTLGRTSAWWS